MKLTFKGLILMYIGLSMAILGSLILGYGIPYAQAREHKILELDLNSGIDIGRARNEYVWWDGVIYNSVATRTRVQCYVGDVLRVREIIKPVDWKGYDAEIFVFFWATYAGEPVAVYNGEDVKFRRSGQTYIGMDTLVGLWLTSPLPLEEMQEKNYFGNWSMKLDYSHLVRIDRTLEVNVGSFLTFIGVALSLTPPLLAWRAKRKREKIEYYVQ